MTTIISMLRGVNVGGHNKINMENLRSLYESLGLRDPRTYVQSGNVVFRTQERDLALLAERIEKAIEHRFGFRPDIILRTASDMKKLVIKNPFPACREINPSRLLVTFLASDPGKATRDEILSLIADPEKVCVNGRELYIYCPNGIARSKLLPAIERTLKKSGTGTSRNWNTVTKLLDIAEKLPASR